MSYRQLATVFDLCDPGRTGRVDTEDLKNLARIYVNGDGKDVDDILRLLNPKRKGSLSFREFSQGVREILGLKHDRNDMMSPVTVATAVDGGAPEPRFVLSPPESPRGADAPKSQCSSLSDGENYEWSGEGDVDSGIANGENLRPRSPANGINRHTWLRTSLRRSPTSHQDNLPNRRWGSFRHNGKRQLGSNALASSSFNSSGRSSTCDTADDMYSDASLEEDVHELHHKFQVLQQQVGVLQDSANHTDERYTRAKAENAALQARVMMLEEQLRDTEMRNDERLQDEQRRSKELVQRIEREKQLQLENCEIRLRAAESEAMTLREEVARQRVRMEKLETERRDLSDQLLDARNELLSCREEEGFRKEQERRSTQDHLAQTHLIEDLSKEVERLRSEARTPALPTTSAEFLRLEELHEEMSSLRNQNAHLQEMNEELQATLLQTSVEQGRLLTAGENSLAAELEAMTHDEPLTPAAESVVKIQQALKEQQEVNAHLRAYIDGILLNIVENHPQLLEVKQKAA